ncbi:MAG TPA: glycosyltransferase [Saprospiraceae bacterium]|nr:glycosyltransferase [Saprospiraceae bacterium]HPN68133.1 glycosyltransferase [Saprospiraceae bacterium]
MKVLFIHRLNVDFPQSKGIVEKEHAIAQAFKFHGYDVDILCNNNHGILLNGKLIENRRFYQTADSVFSRVISVLNDSKYDVIYLRFSPLSFLQYSTFKDVKIKFPNVKILVAVPNFPFLYEFSFFKKMILKFVISKQWKSMHQWADKILHLGPEKEIFGIETIPFDNGIDITEIPQKKVHPMRGNQFNLIYVGSFWQWQGFESLLRGMANVRNNKEYKVNLILVGYGPEISNLKAKIYELGIQEMVTFYPPKYGVELDNIFEEAHIGIGTLHHVSRQLAYSANLKHRNYAARGLPFIYNVPDHAFQRINGAYLIDQKEVNVTQIIEWYKSDVLPNISTISNELRDHASQTLSWRGIVKKVLIAVNLPYEN